jgi:hypothetical protein
MPRCRVSSHYTYTLLITIILISVGFPMPAATYYVSSSTGDDANNGTSTATPWKTLNKICVTTFTAGDSILLNRGDIFHGEISKGGQGFVGTEESSILISAYGTGEKPLLYGDMSSSIWTQRAGYDSIWQTYAGYNLSSFGYEDSAGVWRLMEHNLGEIRFYLSNPDSLDKYLKSFTASSYGPGAASNGWDTIYVKTWDGDTPKVKILRSNIITGTHLIIRDLEFRNWWTAIHPYPIRYSILRNLTFWDSRHITLYLAGHSRYNLVDSCVVNRGGYTGMYSWQGCRNIFRYDTIRNIQDTILGIYASIEQAGIGFQEDTACVAEYCVMENCEDAGFDTYYNVDDTVRYNTVVNCNAGIMLHGTKWVAHNNDVTINGFVEPGISVAILGPGQFHIYDNNIMAVARGLNFTHNTGGGTVLFERNHVTGTRVNTNLSKFEVAGATSINNIFCGLGRFCATAWPNEVFYSTLYEFFAATGYEEGSVWHSDCSDSPTGTFTATPDSLPEGGGSVTLEWTSMNATSASISPLIGTVATSGVDSFTIDSTTVFALTLEGSGGTSLYTARVIVGAEAPGIEPDTLPKFLRIESFPNPFNTVTTVEIYLPEDSHVSLKVFDALGRVIETLAEGWYTRGIHRVRWNTDGIASGVYYCKFTAGSYTETRSMVLVR